MPLSGTHSRQGVCLLLSLLGAAALQLGALVQVTKYEPDFGSPG